MRQPTWRCITASAFHRNTEILEWRNQSINHLFQWNRLHVVLNLDDNIMSVQPTQYAHRGCDILHMRFLSSLSRFFRGVLGHSFWAYLVFTIEIQNKNKNKPILQPKKRKKKIICFVQGLQVFQRRGAWGGGGSPCEGGEITAIRAWLYIRPF